MPYCPGFAKADTCVLVTACHKHLTELHFTLTVIPVDLLMPKGFISPFY